MENNTGYCNCCRSSVIFEVKAAWLRDNYLCQNCSSIPRQRHIQYILDQNYPGWDALTIHESSPSNDYISRYCTDYTASQYIEHQILGSMVNGVRCENIENLSFQSSMFDIFITQDVLEHVFNPEKALMEINRTLKPGGIHIFTAPKHKGLSSSRVRAKLNEDTGEILHLMDAEYHGNPVGDGKALVTWDYGSDFEFLMSSWTQKPVVTFLTKDKEHGLDGEYLEVFIIKNF